MAPGGPKEPEVWLLPFQVSPQQRMGTPQRALPGLRATTLTNRLIKEDSDSEHSLFSDSVLCDKVSGNMSHLNVHASVFQPLSVFNDSASLCFSPERGSFPRWIRKASAYRSSICSASRGYAMASQTAWIWNWCGSCWMAFAMGCSWAHWMEPLMWTHGGVGMGMQSRTERPSCRQLCKMRWPRAVNWGHLLHHLFNSSSTHSSAWCISETWLKCD